MIKTNKNIENINIYRSLTIIFKFIVRNSETQLNDDLRPHFIYYNT
jgi:hypothetical protein